MIANKGGSTNYEIRARLVAHEVRLKHEAAIFAETPPLEAKRLLFSWAARGRRAPDGEVHPLACIDARRAHFQATAARDLYIRLPEEDGGD